MWAASVTPVVKMLKERKKDAEKKKKKKRWTKANVQIYF